MKDELIATIVLDAGLDKPLDYLVSQEFVGKIGVGSLVEVPLRSRTQKGIVIALKKAPADFKLKPLSRPLSDTPLIQEELLKLAFWMTDYYCCSLSDTLKLMLPAIIRGKTQHKEQYVVRRGKTRGELAEEITKLRNKSPLQCNVLDVMLQVEKEIFFSELIEKSEASRSTIETLIEKGLLTKEKMRLDRSPLVNEEYFPSKPKTLLKDQKEAFSKITESLKQGIYASHLLFGVTGSGKTEIYLQVINEALKLGKGTIMLVPEIALTTQTIERFRGRFEGQIAILHHRLSVGERHDEWKKIQRGEAKIVIGARSAIFSPVENLGLIIVDEEHESSYKQSDTSPAYHARDVAVMRASILRAVSILGSATPSLESYYNATTGKYLLSQLTTRPEQSTLPKVHLIDMRLEYEKKKGLTIFSEKLLTEIEKRYKKGEQSILFLNRRGYHTLLLCKACGKGVKCPSCDLSLTFYKGENRLCCHLCGYFVEPPPKYCPLCKAEDPLKFRGIGTEQVEAALYAIFPDIRVMRLDADTTKHKGSHQRLYRSFRTGKADVLIGTQMIAKGLHFPEVTLVGILNGDTSLHFPDFRASETTFQLLTQVAGRAGRGVTPGEVIIQSAIPENGVIQRAAAQDYDAFYQEEIAIRKLFSYPPFASLVKVRFTGKDLAFTREAIENYRLGLIRRLPADCMATPVEAAGHAKIKENHRLQFILKGQKIHPLLQALKTTPRPNTRSVKIFFDVNPQSTYF